MELIGRFVPGPVGSLLVTVPPLVGPVDGIVEDAVKGKGAEETSDGICPLPHPPSPNTSANPPARAASTTRGGRDQLQLTGIPSRHLPT